MNRKLLTALAALFVLYFPAALYLKMIYVPPPRAEKVYWLAYPPFPRLGLAEKGNAYVAWLPPVYDELADNEENPQQSTLILYEDGKPLGPAHSSVEDIK